MHELTRNERRATANVYRKIRCNTDYFELWLQVLQTFFNRIKFFVTYMDVILYYDAGSIRIGAAEARRHTKKSTPS
jgi:hypothetical protein